MSRFSYPPQANVAPSTSSYVVIGLDGTLTSERVLTGTSDQVVVTDNGAGSSVVLSLPQSIATSSAVQFGTLGLGAALTAASGIGTPRFGVTTGSWSEFNSSRPPMVQFQRDFTEPPDSSPGAVQDVFRVYVSSHQSGTVAQGRIGITSRMTDSASVVNKTITGTANDGGEVQINSTAHGFSNGDRINIYGVGGTTEANGVWTIEGVAANSFRLDGSVYANAYTSGGTATNRGLMYAFRGIVNPTLDRGTTTGTGANGDDINAFVAVNTGAGRATEAFYVGESTGVGTGAGAQVGWYAGFAMASDADYGILVTNEQPAASAVTGLPAAAGAFWPTYTANDTNTETRRTLSIKPTLNFGGSNTNKTLNILEIDTTNTATTGTTTNLLSASYGGSARLTLSSGGVLALTGSQTVSTSLQAATASVTTASGTGVFNVGSPTQSPMAMNILSTDQGTLSLQRILAGTGGAGFNGYKARGSGVGSESVALSADVVMNIAGFGYDAATSGQAWPTTATVQLRGLATENHSTTAHGGKFEIRTTPEGSTTIATRATFGTTGVSIGSSTAARGTTAPTNALDIFDGTAPVGTLTNGCTFYSTAGEMRVMDAAGNATLLSPHDKRTNRWIFDSHVGKGKKRTRIIVQMEQMMRKLNDMLGGGYIHEYDDQD